MSKLIKKAFTASRADAHKLIDIERAFNEETVQPITYATYISKTRDFEFRDQDIPVPATAFETKPRKKLWFRLFKRRGTIINEETQEEVEAGSSASSDEGYDEAQNLWPNRRLSNLALIALVFNTSNLLRFPYSCYRFGGCVFLLAYFTLVIIIIQPVICLEMIIGQFSQSGVSGLSRFDIYSDAFTSILSIMCLIFVPYNEIVLGYSGAYMISLLDPSKSHLSDCHEAWNLLESCVPYSIVTDKTYEQNESHRTATIWYENDTVRISLLSSELYFREVILDQVWDAINFDNEFNRGILLGLVITYVLVFISIQKNLTARTAQITVCASTLLPISMLCLIISQLTWPGGWEGIYHFMEFKWHYMDDFEFWAEAIRHAFTSSGIGYGFYQQLASRNPTDFGSFYSTSWIVCTMDFIFCGLSSLIVFSELGIIQHAFQVQDYNEIYAEKTGISFITIVGALLKLGPIWPVITFFAIINLFGIWQQAVATEICTEMLSWFVPTYYTRHYTATIRRILMLVVIALQGFWAILLIHMWPYILDSFNLFGGTWAASFIILTEVFVIIYLYGFKLLMIDVEILVQYSVPLIFQRQIKYVVPFVISVAFIILTADVCIKPETLYLDRIQSPNWVTAIGFLLNVLPAIALIFVGFSAIRRRKEALSRKQEEPPNARGTKRRYELAYHRLRNRRPDVFALSNEQEATIFFQENEECMRRRREAQLDLKQKFIRLSKSNRAKALWERAVNRILLSLGRVNTVRNLVFFVIRECDRLKNIKECTYLDQVVTKFSLENVFQSVQMDESMNPKEEYSRFLQGALTSVPLSDIPDYYRPLTPFELLVGKRIPTKEEEKLAIMIRIKKHLGAPHKKDALHLRKIIRFAREQSYEDSCFFEDPPHEFYAETYGKSIVRIIVVKGADHSLLHSMPKPRPPELRIPEMTVASETVAQTLRNIQAAVEMNMKKRKLFRLSRVKSFRTAMLAATYDNSKTYLYRPTKFPNWHFGAASYPYKIAVEGTYVVVLTNSNDAARKNKFRWLQRRRLRKVWPSFELERPVQVASRLVSFAQLFQEEEVVRKKEAMVNAAADIIFHRDRGSPDDSLQISSTSSSSTSTSGSSVKAEAEEEYVRFMEIPEDGYTIPELFLFPASSTIITEEGDDRTDRKRGFKIILSEDKVALQESQSQIPSDPSIADSLALPVTERQQSIIRTGEVSRKYANVRFLTDSQRSNLSLQIGQGSTTSIIKPLSSSEPAFDNYPRSPIPSVHLPADTSTEDITGSRTSAKVTRRRSRSKDLTSVKLVRLRNRSSNFRSMSVPMSHIRLLTAETNEDMPIKNTLSLKAVCSQTSLVGQGGMAFRTGRIRQDMTHWNDSDNFAYRSEGRALLVESREEAENVFVWARDGDSIASLENVDVDVSMDALSIKRGKRKGSSF